MTLAAGLLWANTQQKNGNARNASNCGISNTYANATIQEIGKDAINNDEAFKCMAQHLAKCTSAYIVINEKNIGAFKYSITKNKSNHCITTLQGNISPLSDTPSFTECNQSLWLKEKGASDIEIKKQLNDASADYAHKLYFKQLFEGDIYSLIEPGYPQICKRGSL